MIFPDKFVLKPTKGGEFVGLVVAHVVEFDGSEYIIKYLSDEFPYTGEIIQQWLEFGWYTVEGF